MAFGSYIVVSAMVFSCLASEHSMISSGQAALANEEAAYLELRRLILEGDHEGFHQFAFERYLTMRITPCPESRMIILYETVALGLAAVELFGIRGASSSRDLNRLEARVADFNAMLGWDHARTLVATTPDLFADLLKPSRRALLALLPRDAEKEATPAFLVRMQALRFGLESISPAFDSVQDLVALARKAIKIARLRFKHDHDSTLGKEVEQDLAGVIAVMEDYDAMQYGDKLLSSLMADDFDTFAGLVQQRHVEPPVHSLRTKPIVTDLELSIISRAEARLLQLIMLAWTAGESNRVKAYKVLLVRIRGEQLRGEYAYPPHFALAGWYIGTRLIAVDQALESEAAKISQDLEIVNMHPVRVPWFYDLAFTYCEYLSVSSEFNLQSQALLGINPARTPSANTSRDGGSPLSFESDEDIHRDGPNADEDDAPSNTENDPSNAEDDAEFGEAQDAQRLDQESNEETEENPEDSEQEGTEGMEQGAVVHQRDNWMQPDPELSASSSLDPRASHLRQGSMAGASSRARSIGSNIREYKFEKRVSKKTVAVQSKGRNFIRRIKWTPDPKMTPIGEFTSPERPKIGPAMCFNLREPELVKAMIYRFFLTQDHHYLTEVARIAFTDPDTGAPVGTISKEVQFVLQLAMGDIASSAGKRILANIKSDRMPKDAEQMQDLTCLRMLNMILVRHRAPLRAHQVSYADTVKAEPVIYKTAANVIGKLYDIQLTRLSHSMREELLNVFPTLAYGFYRLKCQFKLLKQLADLLQLHVKRQRFTVGKEDATYAAYWTRYVKLLKVLDYATAVYSQK